MEELQPSTSYYHHSIANSLSITSFSSSPNASNLSSLDLVIFCIVIVLSLCMGLLHAYLISRQNGQNSSNPPETANQYNSTKTRSHIASNSTSECNLSKRNSSVDIDGVENERKPSVDENGTNNNRNNVNAGDDAITQRHGLQNGLALMSSTNRTIFLENVDIMFQLVCFASVIVTLGLPMYSYFHGPSLAISVLPAMLAAHVTSIGIVIPFLKVYNQKNASRHSGKQTETSRHTQHTGTIFFLSYLKKRFGGSVYNKNRNVKHIEMSNNQSDRNVSFLVLLILTWTLIFLLWGFITVSRADIKFWKFFLY